MKSLQKTTCNPETHGRMRIRHCVLPHDRHGNEAQQFCIFSADPFDFSRSSNSPVLEERLCERVHLSTYLYTYDYTTNLQFCQEAFSGKKKKREKEGSVIPVGILWHDRRFSCGVFFRDLPCFTEASVGQEKRGPAGFPVGPLLRISCFEKRGQRMTTIV